MEKYGPVILYFLLGVVVGYIGMSFSKNVGKGNPHRTSTFKTVGSNDFYYNPKLDDVYFITDTLSSERTALYTFGITNDSITFAKIVNLDNFSFESVVTLIYQSRSDKMTMYNNLDRRLKTIAIDQLSPDFLWEQGKSLRIYRIYPTTKVTSTLLAFSSPIGLIIILISFVIIWFG